MEAMTISKVRVQRNKVDAQLDTARRTHGKPGRSGAPLDNMERVRKLERELSDWDRLLAYAESD